MAIITEDLSHLKWRLGHNFIAFYVAQNMASNAFVDIVIRVGSENISTTGLQFSGGSALLTWEYFAGVTLISPTGTSWPIIPMNEAAQTQLGAEVLINPGILEDGGGQPIGGALVPSPVDFYGFNAADSRVSVRGKLLDMNYVLLANTSYLLRVQNRHTGVSNLEVLQV